MSLYDLSTFSIVTNGIYPESWLWIEKQNIAIDFEALWSLRPTERGRFKIMGKEIEAPRYLRIYGRDYTFGGLDHESEPIPAFIQPFVDYASTTIGLEYNSALVNFYETPSDRIGSHSDNSKPLKDSTVFSWTFYPSVATIPRVFRIKNKTTKAKHDFILEDKMLVIMGGHCQRDYTHEVPKITKTQLKKYGLTTDNCGDQRRVNITTRCFKE